MTPLRATVSGSFRQAMPQVLAAVEALQRHGVTVLSPRAPHVTGWIGAGFALLEGDRFKTVRENQDFHFDCIRRSDFLWIVCPDGYIGNSTAGEIGAARAFYVPVFAKNPIATPTCDELAVVPYIRVVDDCRHAIDWVQSRPRRVIPPRPPSLFALNHAAAPR